MLTPPNIRRSVTSSGMATYPSTDLRHAVDVAVRRIAAMRQMPRKAKEIAPTSLDKSPTTDGAMSSLLRSAIGFVCIVVGVIVCANSAWGPIKRLWCLNMFARFGRSKDAASFARKMAAAHAAIGYHESEVLADAAVSRELDRLMRHNGSKEPKLALKDITTAADGAVEAKADAGGAIGKVKEVASADSGFANAKNEIMTAGTTAQTKLKPAKNKHASRKGALSASDVELKETPSHAPLQECRSGSGRSVRS
ncbi:MAG: hypothetical protein ACKER6_00955 [Candidatus Hodgkinia cicadicola]